MGFRVLEDPGELRIELSGLDRLLSWRRSVRFETSLIEKASLARRGELEPAIDHRVSGFGTHDGTRRPGRRRVGTMMGRGVRGNQWWAVPRGGADQVLVVLDLSGDEFSRAVLYVSERDGFTDGRWTGSRSHP